MSGTFVSWKVDGITHERSPSCHSKNLSSMSSGKPNKSSRRNTYPSTTQRPSKMPRGERGTSLRLRTLAKKDHVSPINQLLDHKKALSVMICSSITLFIDLLRYLQGCICSVENRLIPYLSLGRELMILVVHYFGQWSSISKVCLDDQAVLSDVEKIFCNYHVHLYLAVSKSFLFTIIVGTPTLLLSVMIFNIWIGVDNPNVDYALY